MMKHFAFLAILALLSISLVGCSGNKPLQGTVKFEDGTPLTVGMVNFVSSEHGLSRGRIQSDGSFQVGSVRDTDGLPPGTYKIYITGAFEAIETPAGPVQRDEMGNVIESAGAMRLLIALRYVTEENTPLTVEIPAPGNRHDIVVTRFAN